MEEKRVEYVWQWPVRIVHWVNFVSIIVLSVTGLYIGYPFIEAPSGALAAGGPFASHQTASGLMTWMRFVHFLFGVVLTLSLASRIVWYFLGNQYAHWRTLLPLTAKQRSDFWGALRYYLFLQKEYPPEMGHTYLAAAAYGSVFFLIGIQCLTGFALYFLDSGSTTLAWVFPLFAGLNWTRFIHHALTWIFVCFFIHHFYSCVLIDIDEKNGLISSMFSGWKGKS